MNYVPTKAGVRPAVRTNEAEGAETAQRAVGTRSSTPSVCYHLLLLTLSVLFVPLVMLFCVALWFVRFIKHWSLTQRAYAAKRQLGNI
jgi:hypothetical protein